MHARKVMHNGHDVPAAKLSSQTKGRTRIRIPSKRNDGAYFAHLRKELRKSPDVEEVVVNPVTASGLIIHKSGHKLETDGLRDFGHEHKLFELGAEGAVEETLGRTIAERLHRIDKRLKESTNGRYDLSSLSFAGLLGLGVLQLLRGEILSPASTLLADAFELLPEVRKEVPFPQGD